MATFRPSWTSGATGMRLGLSSTQGPRGPATIGLWSQSAHFLTPAPRLTKRPAQLPCRPAPVTLRRFPAPGEAPQRSLEAVGQLDASHHAEVARGFFRRTDRAVDVAGPARNVANLRLLPAQP